MEHVTSGHIIEGILTATVLFFGWLLKRSIYGEIETLKKEIEDMRDKCITQHACDTQRSGCSSLLIEKIDHLSDVLKVITDRQVLLINRFDTHINGREGR